MTTNTGDTNFIIEIKCPYSIRHCIANNILVLFKGDL